MATLVLRTVIGTPLTNQQVDDNFSNINSEVGVVFNRANTINSNVGVLSNLTTTEKSNLVAAMNETVTIARGGTGQITRSAALNALLPAQTGNSSYTLKTDATNAYWSSDIDTTAVTITDDTSTNSTYYIALTTATSGTINSANVSTTKLFFNPSTGLLTSTDYNSASDIALKENLTPIANPMSVLEQLNGFKFTWKETGENAFGLTAQDVEKVIPEIVKSRPDGYKGINYLNIIAFLVEAVKDLKQEIQELKNR